ncbi:hypothetical protein BDN70DRAFT_205166 [Pholiota conissans]|uniref:Uncharacterized protein n=1 Tax=Pholiota conissans TaxID=109636 RepID=A0A9P5YU82_9AGAR|nr:hypothetical protein BDN70DRAFT_205166 [Pholiota conissans]
MSSTTPTKEDLENNAPENPASIRQETPPLVNEQSVALFESEQTRNVDSGRTNATELSSIAPSEVPSDSTSRPISRAFIGGCQGIEIKSGEFTQIHGHQFKINMTVNIPPSEGAQSIPQQPPESIAHPETASSQNIANMTTLPTAHVPNSSSTAAVREEAGSARIYAPQISNKIYEQHLEPKGRGFPLWIPEPNKRLPLPYRCAGVNVGDVGIITPSGAFSFLFNICLPSEHPINPDELPEGFVPILMKPTDISEFSVFKPKSHLASAFIDKVDDPQSRGLTFETSAAEGCILVLPEGGTALDLQNIRRFRAYATAHIESWYRYANGTRGLEVKNGEIRLVIGCDKAPSWGMAALSNFTQNKKYRLKYLPIATDLDRETTELSAVSIPLYQWECSGFTEARVGPDPVEIEELKRSDVSTAALVDGKYWNQCLFLRTLNMTLSDEAFSEINLELDLALDLEMEQYNNIGRVNTMPGEIPTSGSASNEGQASQPGGNTAIQRQSSFSQNRPYDASFRAVSRKRHITMSKTCTTFVRI